MSFPSASLWRKIKNKKAVSDHPALSIHVKTSFNFLSIVRHLVYTHFCFFDREVESLVWFSLSEILPRACLCVTAGKIFVPSVVCCQSFGQDLGVHVQMQPQVFCC